MACPNCSTPVPAGGRFCPTCGLDMQSRSDERRVVTVLFGDLVGFTSMSEQADPERIKVLVDRAFERLVQDIRAFGGRVDKIIGDAIVALFGAPVANEDDPERAVRAALAMQDTLDGYRKEMRTDRVHMRIGINTGEVLTGAMRAGGDYTAMGDVVNIANRLQAAASPGEVLVGASTHEATSQAIAYDALGVVDARGREAPVEAWRATEALLLPGRQPRRARSPLIGRDSELTLLREGVRLAASKRRASLILLLGDSGVGKTRLADELAEYAASDLGAERVDSRCVPYGEANVWYPIGSALRSLAAIAEGAGETATRERIREVVLETFSGADDSTADTLTTGLLYFMGYSDGLEPLEPHHARDEAARALQRFLAARTTDRPLVMRVADLHWADDLVLGLIGDLLNQMTRSPFILVCGARHLLDARWSPHTGRYNYLILNLESLDRAASERLLDELVGESTLAPELREQLIARSGGNPFFLEELSALTTRNESESGVGLRFLPSFLTTQALETEHELPETLRGLVAERLDRIVPEERRVLEDAAVIGTSGPVFALGVMAERSDGTKRSDGWRMALNRLADRELLNVSGARWSFRSNLVREVAYSTLTKADRAQRHAEIALWMEAQLGDERPEEDVVNRIAHHYGVAAGLVKELGFVPGTAPDLTERALQWVGEAARRAQAAEIHVVAARLYTTALELAGREPSPQRLAYLLGRAEARHGLFEIEAAERDVAAALTVADALDDRHGKVRAMLAKAELLRRRNDHATTSQLLDEARALAAELGDRLAEAEALRQVGMTRLFQGDYEAANAATSEALTIFAELDDRRGEAWAQQNLAWIAYLSGRVAEAESRVGDSAATFSELGATGGLAWSNALLAFTRFHHGRFGEAEKLAEEILPDAVERGDRFGEAMMLMLTALVRLWTGRTVQAVERADEARTVFGRMGDSLGLAQADAVYGRALVAVGRISEGTAVLERFGVATSPRGSNGAAQEIGLVASALAHLHLGNPADASTSLEALADEPNLNDLGSDERLGARALCALQLGQPARAIEMLDAHSGSPAPFLLAIRALALNGVGDNDGALSAADAAHESDRATYLDLAFAYTAAGFASAALGDVSEVIAAFAGARQEVDQTDDLVAQAIVRFGEACALAMVGATSARSVQREADRRLSNLGIGATGWATVFHTIEPHGA